MPVVNTIHFTCDANLSPDCESSESFQTADPVYAWQMVLDDGWKRSNIEVVDPKTGEKTVKSKFWCPACLRERRKRLRAKKTGKGGNT